MNKLIAAFLLALPGFAGALSLPVTPENHAAILSIPDAVMNGLVLDDAAAKGQPSPAQAPAAPVVILPLTKATFDKEVKQSKIPVLVYYYMDSCPACKKVAPLIQFLADQNAGKAKFCKVDVAAEEQLAKDMKIDSVPTFYLFKDGKAQEMILVIEIDKATKQPVAVRLVPKP